MEIKIGGTSYKLEYSFEAALETDFVEKVLALFDSAYEGDDAEKQKEATRNVAAIPNTVITMFYAGLLENNPVKDEAEAKALLKQHFAENKDDPKANFYGMAEAIFEQMSKDGFFELIGLPTETAEVPEQPKQPKVPQDHKKKAVTEK